MSHPIRRAAVIGAGTMGAGIAAHLANAGIPVLLLDIPPQDAPGGPPAGGGGTAVAERAATKVDRNAIVKAGLERVRKAKPAVFMDPDRMALIEIGNTEDDLARVAEADWVVEAIIEKLDAKRALWEQLEKLVSPTAVVTSNSSGIPMRLQVEGRGDSFRRRFLGTHFFNPPRYLHLLELIPTPDTDPAVLQSMVEFGDRVLGKGIVVAHDVPGFAANRIGMYNFAQVIRAMLDLKLTPDVIDAITGPLVGRPKSASFRTIDLSGLDIVAHVSEGLAAATGEDVKLPPVILKMVEKKMLGDKTGQGFFKKVKGADGQSVILTLNLATFEYEDKGKVRLAELAPLVGLPTAVDRIRALLQLDAPVGEFARRTFFELFNYAAGKVGEVADSAREIDNALKWGFGWEMGPFETAGALGLADLPGLLRRSVEDFSPALKAAVESLEAAVPGPEGPIILSAVKKVAGSIVRSNADASLIDLGDGVALLEFHSKANSIGQGVLEMFEAADTVVRESFAGLVVGNQGANFCAGADLGMMLHLCQSGSWEQLDAAVRAFQGMTTRLRYAPYPVVAAPFGLTLGGGCEVAVWSDAVQAGAELYTGLVEIGVGIIPAGGGTTEMLIRFTSHGEGFDGVRRAFELIALAKVSGSALDARKLGLLRDSDSITMNSDRVIADAKHRVLDLARGYVAPVRRRVKVQGESAYANLCAGVYLMREGKQITEYEEHLARTLARVLTGGTMNVSDTVDEQVILDLEREAFLHLAGQEKTQARIAHTLKTGKTLRN